MSCLSMTVEVRMDLDPLEYEMQVIKDLVIGLSIGFCATVVAFGLSAIFNLILGVV